MPPEEIIFNRLGHHKLALIDLFTFLKMYYVLLFSYILTDYIAHFSKQGLCVWPGWSSQEPNPSNLQQKLCHIKISVHNFTLSVSLL